MVNDELYCRMTCELIGRGHICCHDCTHKELGCTAVCGDARDSCGETGGEEEVEERETYFDGEDLFRE